MVKPDSEARVALYAWERSAGDRTTLRAPCDRGVLVVEVFTDPVAMRPPEWVWVLSGLFGVLALDIMVEEGIYGVSFDLVELCFV